MYVADLHVHSKYSRATSRDCDAPHMDLLAREKGLGLIGTGDFTHPGWRAELREALVPAGDGLYALRVDLRLPARVANAGEGPLFCVTGEVSSIYKKDGKTRKVHSLILLPSLEAADALAERLEAIGNIRSDGRPILGLDARDLAEIALDVCPEAEYIPAHIWTPHFSLFGAFSDFSSVEECYGDMTGEIHAMETGLSSDPPMNWMVSLLDRYALVSNSDAHSPAKLGREATLLRGERSYPALRRALRTGEGLAGTLEFFPEEGKYHLDGHRKCAVRLEPGETSRLGGRCPACGGKITVGVKHRVLELADRPEGFIKPGAKPFESLAPLAEVLGEALGASSEGRAVKEARARLIAELGPETYILRQASASDIEAAAGAPMAEAVRRVREGRVRREAGYDGEYGSIRLFEPGEREALAGQMSLFGAAGPKRPGKRSSEPLPRTQREPDAAPRLPDDNPEQLLAVMARERAVAVIAGPGTGKTSTLVRRIAYLIEERRVRARDITAVTFTNQAAAQLRERLAERLGGRSALRGMAIGTFHAVCLGLLEEKPLLGESEARDIVGELLAGSGLRLSPREALEAISAVKNGACPERAGIDAPFCEAYAERCRELGARDLDDVLAEALALPDGSGGGRHILVDEFQDVNAMQRALVRKWAKGCAGLFAIGDPDQSIYGFRGASAACFDELREDFPDLREIRLSRNYRSTPQILECASRVIERNPGGARRLAATVAGGAPVRVVRARSAAEEGVWIARAIADMAGGLDMLGAKSPDSGRAPRPFSDIAVLARTRRQLAAVESCLRHDGIPCVVSGRGDELNDDGVRGALAFFRVCLNPADEAARRLCLRLAWGGDPRSPGEGFAAEREAYLPLVKRERPRALVERWAKSHGDSAALRKLRDTAALYDDMASLLSALTLGEEADVRRASGRRFASGAVRLMTLHGAKGLEFPAVFLAGADEGALPLEREGERADVCEERRLFYVGMTRAREELIVTCSGRPSPFLADMPAGVSMETARARRVPAGEQTSLF